LAAKFGYKQVKALLLLILASCVSILAAQVVINEVCYDPDGADERKEWIELFNAGQSDMDLQGCEIWSGGSTYTRAFVFGHFILRPGRFVLIGGAEVPNAHFTCNFSFHNGGSASDAIRFVNADSTYTDTVIYDEPNDNHLIDDTGMPATHFAPDVPSGFSLARISDGYDTNNSMADLYAEPNPTPGMMNRRYADYAISSPYFSSESNLLDFWVCNRSHIVPTQVASGTVVLDGDLVWQEDLPPIPAKDSIYVAVTLDPGWWVAEITVLLPDDPLPENNSTSLYTAAVDLQLPVLNEVFAAPESGKPEWLELWQEARPRAKNLCTTLFASGAKARFSLPALPGYFVICANAANFLAEYPSLPANRVVQSSGWPSLNNTGDTLILLADDEVQVLDTMSYTAEQVTSGRSLERYLDNDGNPLWRLSTNPDGSSPGVANDNTVLPPQEQRLKLIGSPIDPRKAESLTVSFSLPDDPSRVNCFIYDLAGRKICTLADNSLVPARGSFEWNGRTGNGQVAPRGIYLLLWESQGSGKVYRKQHSFVVK